MTAGDEHIKRIKQIAAIFMMICLIPGMSGGRRSLSHTEKVCVFDVPLQICLFCTIWHQKQQTAERWLLLVVPPLKWNLLMP